MDLEALRKQSEEKRNRRKGKQQDADRHRSDVADVLVSQQSKVLGKQRDALTLLGAQESELTERQREVRQRKMEIDVEKAKMLAEKALKAAEEEARQRQIAETLDAEKRAREAALRAKKEKLLAGRMSWAQQQKARIVEESNAATAAAAADREDSARKLREEREEQERERLRAATEAKRAAEAADTAAMRKAAEQEKFRANSPEEVGKLDGIAARIAAMKLA